VGYATDRARAYRLPAVQEVAEQEQHKADKDELREIEE
jgi:hypothetical protein